MDDPSTITGLAVLFALMVLAVLAWTLRSYRRLTPEQQEAMRAPGRRPAGRPPLVRQLPRVDDRYNDQDSGGDSGRED